MFGRYYLYFVPVDGEEAAHYHVNAPKPVRVGSAKIWIYADGKTEIAKRGNIPDKDLKEICLHIQDNYLFYLRKWEEFFGNLHIYGESEKEFTIVEDKSTGNAILKEKTYLPKELDRVELFKQKYNISNLSSALEKSIRTLPDNVWVEQEPIYAEIAKRQS
ncbi:MAG: DUF4160 domain-containing protein [Firmicutes bacterium]|nr:DUF4160 domain-containing protein [Bacillota bacterium]